MAPLDDTFIFLQYAKQLSRGHLFEYTPGGGFSTGASSPLYPFLLMPFFWLGLKGVEMLVITFGFGALCLLLSALLLWKLANSWFSHKSMGLFTALFLLLNGNLLWGFLSGMDAALFATLILLTIYAVDRWLNHRSKKSFLQVLLLLVLLSIARPEGIALAIVAVLFFTALVLRQQLKPPQLLWIVLAAFVPNILLLMLNWLYTGSLKSNGLLAKAIFYHPYYNLWDILRVSSTNFIQIWSGYYANIMPDELYRQFKHTLIFPYFPPFALVFFLLGLLALFTSPTSSTSSYFSRILLFLFFIGGISSLCFLDTIFAHSQRYFHPYQPIFLLVMTTGIYWLAELFKSKSRDPATSSPQKPVVRLFALVLLISSIPSVFYWASEYGENCNDLYNQHRRMSWWVKDATPPNAVIGLTDSGLIPYYVERRYLDFVGLVSNDMAQWWRQGTGTVFEKMERLPKTWLPVYIITHPAVWGKQNFLGKPVYQVELLDNSVSLGPALVAYQQDWSILNSGRFPALKYNFLINEQIVPARVVDELDVADLESELQHNYRWRPDPERYSPHLWPPPQNLFNAHKYHSSDKFVADGGRKITDLEEFTLSAVPHQPAKLVLRTTDNVSTITLVVLVNARYAGEWVIRGKGSESAGEGVFSAWQESEFSLPAALIEQDKIKITLRCNWSHISHDDIHHSYHYWLLQPATK